MFPWQAVLTDPPALLEVYPGCGCAEFTGGLLIWRLGGRDWGLETGKLGVEGAFDRQAAAVEDMGVDHGGADILVTQ
jgi:hypothetical protein